MNPAPWAQQPCDVGATAVKILQRGKLRHRAVYEPTYLQEEHQSWSHGVPTALPMLDNCPVAWETVTTHVSSVSVAFSRPESRRVSILPVFKLHSTSFKPAPFLPGNKSLMS